MTDVVIERFRITCRSTSAERTEALAMRRRLESVARLHLPVALERAVPWMDAQALGSLRVVLDFDPSRYDDVTVALLWADRIRQRVIAATAGHGRPAAAAEAPTTAPGLERDDVAALTSILRGRDVESVALRALAGDAGALGALRAVAAEPAVADAFLHALPATLRPALAALLEDLDGETVGASRTASAPERRPMRTIPEAASERERVDDLLGATTEGLPPEVEDDVDAASRRELGAPRSPEPGSPSVGISYRTAVGGVALLWPWLPAFLEQAAALHPGMQAVSARRLALARLVPDCDGVDGDALTRFLTGDDLESPALTLATLARQDEIDEAAHGVLRSFASVLPGLERSSFDYLRRELLVRPGALDLGVQPARLTLSPMPLDPVLAFLPYPIGMVKLPWTTPFAIDLERRA